MVLTFAEDFTAEANLDTELLGAPSSGLFWNRGVHPNVSVNNLLTMLPYKPMTFAAYEAGTTYGVFNDSRKKSDIVTDGGIIYQSLTASNIGNTPASSPANWLPTNLDSLRIKSFIWTVEDNVLAALSLNRMLIENQLIYNTRLDPTLKTPSGDYMGWVFEPKGSDYVAIRINSIAFQANTAVAQNLYVINQGVLIDTLALNPNNGILEFEELNYTVKGKGEFLFVTEAQEVLVNEAYNDALKYTGFVCYPISGSGATPEGAEYSAETENNGMHFNVSCYLDSSEFVTKNKIDLAKFYQTQFEYDFMRLEVYNSNNRFNIDERNQRSNPELLAAETLDINSATVARKYSKEKSKALEAISKTFDKFLVKKRGVKVKRKTI